MSFIARGGLTRRAKPITTIFNPMKNKTTFIARQGDILIERIDSFPSNLKKIAREQGRVVLAHGEVTGHHHSILDKHADLYSAVDSGDVTFLEIKEAVAALSHQEHATINLPPGNYKVTRQREYTPEAIRRVAD